jgi:hypothetical protein
MLLQYPKLSNSSRVAHYEDYRKAHRDFMKVYKVLYEEVCGFSFLPEKFIQEAEPIIDQYLEKDASTQQLRIGLLAITDFINNFYLFMDEATEMFTEHQALAGQTMKYMEKVSFLNRKNQDRYIRDCEEDYVQLIPELNSLRVALNRVKEKVEKTNESLVQLKPGRFKHFFTFGTCMILTLANHFCNAAINNKHSANPAWGHTAI